MTCCADPIRAGKELGCVAESARKTHCTVTVEIEEIMKRSEGFTRVLHSIGPPGGLGRYFPHTKSARMGEGSRSPEPHGDYLMGRRTDIEKAAQRKRDTKKTASEMGF